MVKPPARADDGPPQWEGLGRMRFSKWQGLGNTYIVLHRGGDPLRAYSRQSTIAMRPQLRHRQ